jgi:hypothetical protein
MSDHSLISGELVTGGCRLIGSDAVFVRSWKNFDADAFRMDLSASDLVVNPPATWSDLLACYDASAA